MTPEQVRALYDQRYAETYDATFREGSTASPLTKHERSILKLLLDKGGPWLDVGCGTGYFLKQFPHIERTGLDLSPAMLRIAQKANPSATLVGGNFLEPHPQWNGKFRVVTCMWYAYTLVDSIRDVEVAINNMADWTSTDGFLFVPVCDPHSFVGEFPDSQPWWDAKSSVRVTGVTWNFEQPGKNHVHLVSPTTEVMREMLSRRFHSVTKISYETVAFLAKHKR